MGRARILSMLIVCISGFIVVIRVRVRFVGILSLMGIVGGDGRGEVVVRWSIDN